MQSICFCAQVLCATELCGGKKENLLCLENLGRFLSIDFIVGREWREVEGENSEPASFKSTRCIFLIP